MASPSHDLVRQITLISAFSPLTTTSQTSLPTPILGRNCRYFKLEDDLKDSLSESVRRFDPSIDDLGPVQRPRLHRFSPFRHGEPRPARPQRQAVDRPSTHCSGCSTLGSAGWRSSRMEGGGME